jgi:predicted ester cyclase
VRSYFAALETKDVAGLDMLVSDDLVFVTPLRPLGKQDLLGVFRAIWGGFPDWSFNHGELVATGDVVSTKLRMAGTHTATFVPPLGRLKPVSPTGTKVVLPEQEFVYHVENGRIIRIIPEDVPGGGVPGLLRQIGVKLPPLWLMRIVMSLTELGRRIRPS